MGRPGWPAIRLSAKRLLPERAPPRTRVTLGKAGDMVGLSSRRGCADNGWPRRSPGSGSSVDGAFPALRPVVQMPSASPLTVAGAAPDCSPASLVSAGGDTSAAAGVRPARYGVLPGDLADQSTRSQ